jgi:hypothetical protein
MGPDFAETVCFDSGYCRANHRPRLIVGPGSATMHRRPIVPHQHVALSPAVLVSVLRSGCAGDQFVQQGPRVCVVHPVDGVGVRGDVERNASIDRVSPGHAPSHRRQSGALGLCRQARIDLVAGVGISMRGDGAAQTFLNRRRQMPPGLSGGGELGLAPVLRNDAGRQDRRKRRRQRRDYAGDCKTCRRLRSRSSPAPRVRKLGRKPPARRR